MLATDTEHQGERRSPRGPRVVSETAPAQQVLVGTGAVDLDPEESRSVRTAPVRVWNPRRLEDHVARDPLVAPLPHALLDGAGQDDADVRVLVIVHGLGVTRWVDGFVEGEAGGVRGRGHV